MVHARDMKVNEFATRTRVVEIFPGIKLCQIGYDVGQGQVLEYSLQNGYSGGAALLTSDQWATFIQNVNDAGGIEGIFEL